MATIDQVTACAGGNHIRFRVTLGNGTQLIEHLTLAELQRAIDDSGKRDYIIAQVAALRRANPGDTLTQFRNRVQATEFQE